MDRRSAASFSNPIPMDERVVAFLAENEVGVAAHAPDFVTNSTKSPLDRLLLRSHVYLAIVYVIRSPFCVFRPTCCEIADREPGTKRRTAMAPCWKSAVIAQLAVQGHYSLPQ